MAKGWKVVRRTKQVWADEELIKLIDFIIAKHLLANKKPPSIQKITKMIAKRIDKEDLLRDELIRF